MSLHCLYGCRNLFGENHFGIFSPLVINHFLSGFIGVFLHVGCIPNSTSEFAMIVLSKCVMWDKVRFRNHISTLPQPNFGDSATKIRHASATKKRRFRNQKITDSATKNDRFRNQQKDDSATKTRGFRNQNKRISQPKRAIPQPPSA